MPERAWGFDSPLSHRLSSVAPLRLSSRPGVDKECAIEVSHHVEARKRPVCGRAPTAQRGAMVVNIGEPRRTIYIEPIEEPTSAPAEPLPPATTPDPSYPPTKSEPEPAR